MCVCISFNVPLSVGLLLTSSEGVCICLIQCPSVCWTATDIVRGCVCYVVLFSILLSVGTSSVCVCVCVCIMLSCSLLLTSSEGVYVSFNVPLSVGFCWILLTSSECIICLIQCPSVCWTATDIVRGCMCVMLFHSMSLCLLDFY